MSYHIEKSTGDLVIDGFEKGISPSPHEGLANLQNVNISTEMGEVMCSFSRVQQSIIPFSGTNAFFLGSNTLTYAGATTLLVGMAVTVSAGITGLTAGNYYILTVGGVAGNQNFTLTATYGGTVVTGMSGSTSQNVTFTSLNISQPVSSATEEYYDGTLQQYRYFILDVHSQVWVHDTGTTWSSIFWTAVDAGSSVVPTGAVATGLAVYQGYLHLFGPTAILVKETCLLGAPWIQTNLFINSTNITEPHFAIVTKNIDSLTFTDSNYVPNIQANASPTAIIPSVFSYGMASISTYIVTVNPIFSGNFPLQEQKITFTSSGTLPANISTSKVYYVCLNSATNATYLPHLSQFSVSLTVGGAALDLSGGSGNLYFNSYNPSFTTNAVASDTNNVSTLVFNAQTGALPPGQITQSLVEIGSTIIVGCQSNILYPLNEQDFTYTNIINLPENNAIRMIAVNNMAYIFAGNKGNIYITNGSTATGVISVPDYCAGIAGTASTYIEPYFSWGGSEYIRGRIYFSIQDQTASKAGNCGGIWSFVPTHNLYIGQDIGLSLRMENTNSYGTLNGMTNVLVPNQNQAAIGVQYFGAWTSDANTPIYGIDGSGTFPNISAIIETDVIPTGTMLEKDTFKQIEYKLSSPLLSGESVSMKWRQNATDAWSSFGTLNSDNALSGYYPVNFEKGQWLQIQVTLTPNGTSTFSGNRLSEIRLR